MMDDNKEQNIAEKQKKKRSQGGQPKKESKKKSQDFPKSSTMPSTVQHHPGTDRPETIHQDRLAPDAQGTRLHNLPPKKSLSPSFMASHAVSIGQEVVKPEQTHTVQHLPTSQGQGDRSQGIPDMRFIGQMLGAQYQQFTGQTIDQGGLLRQQLLQGVRTTTDTSYHSTEPSLTSYHRPDPPRSSPSYPSPPPNRTVHNIPGASPPGMDRGRPHHTATSLWHSIPDASSASYERGRPVHNVPGSSPPGIERGRQNIPAGSPPGRTKENFLESERTSPYHVSTIRKTPSPAPKHRFSPASTQLSPHYRHDRVSPASGEKQLSPHYRHDRVSPASAERQQLSLEEALKLMQGHPSQHIEEALKLLGQHPGYPGANVLQQQLTRSEPGTNLHQQPVRSDPGASVQQQQPARSEPDEFIKTKDTTHKPERSQFISTMLANQARSRHSVPNTTSHGLTVDPEHVTPQSQFVRMPSGLPRQIPGDIPRQILPSSGLLRQVSPSGGVQRQTLSTHAPRLMSAAIPSSVLQTTVPQVAQLSTALLQPHTTLSTAQALLQTTGHSQISSTGQPQTSPGQALLQPQATSTAGQTKRIPSPKPQHRHKDFAQAQHRGTTSNIHIPDSAGPIRQPVVELVKIPFTKSTDGKLPTFSASQMTGMSSSTGLVSHPVMSLPGNLPFSQSSQAQNVTMATKPGQAISNPFTFPAKPLGMSHPKSQPRYEVISPVVQPVLEHKRKLSDIEMPQLDPVPPLHKETSPVKTEMVKMKSPFNMRLQNLANLPTNSMYRSTYRAHSMAVHRAKAGLITSTAKTLDLLRQNLQKFINKEIDVIVKQYLDKFFKPGIENIKGNNGENSVTDEHVQAVCRQILEEAKKMYTTEQRSTTPVRDENTPIPFAGRKRNASDTDSDKSASYLPRKKKGRPPIYTSGRSTPSKPSKANEPVKREGPKWDSARLVSTTQFIMGARANKALGLGATRGRIYIKHPDVFKYCGDQDDKQWLYENHKMPATGGKAYMMLLEDVKDLAEDDEYRNNANVMMDEIMGFCIPDWMTEKVKVQMESLRTDKAKQHSRSTTPSEGQQGTQQDAGNLYKDLPFSNFTSVKDSPSKEGSQASLSGDTEMEFLTGGDNEDQNQLSPFNLTGGFDEGVSPSASDLDNLEEEAPLSAPFEFSK